MSEAHLWGALKGQVTGYRFRRQVPIGHWIADFACLNPKVVVEVDDPSHEWRDESLRTAYLESHGFTVIRFSNHMVAQGNVFIADTITGILDHICGID